MEPPARADGNFLYVSETGSTWSSIQDAVDNSTAGDTIVIAPGNYTGGFLLLHDSIDITGNHTEGEINVKAPGEEAVVGISSDRTNISGINIIGEGSHIYALMVSSCRNTTFTGVNVITDVSSGIYVRDCFDVVFLDVLIDSGERSALEISDVDRLRAEDVDIVTEGSREAVWFTGGSHDIVFSNSSVSMDGELSIAFRAEDGLDLTIDNMSVSYQREFINMETGNVDIYDTVFGWDDINITSDNVNDTVKVYFRKELEAYYENRPFERDLHGRFTPAGGVELNITGDGGPIYRTDRYGGSDPATNEMGTIEGKLTLLYANYTGDASGPHFNSAELEAYLEADMNNTLNMTGIVTPDGSPILIRFEDVWYSNGNVFGQVLHEGGPDNGTPVVNATVELSIPFDHDDLVVGPNVTSPIPEVFGTTVTNGTGHFEFVEVPFGHDLILRIVAEDAVEDGGNTSGYTSFETVFDHHIREYRIVNGTVFHSFRPGEDYPHSGVTVRVPYYEFVPPTAGPVSGTVRYQGGVLDGRVAENATVVLYDSSGAVVDERTTGENGTYLFTEIPFNDWYELRATPSGDVLGVNNVRSGYLFWDGSAFNHTDGTVFNISLKYYEHVPPVVNHPKLSILDRGNDPIPGVLVTVTVNGTDHRSHTNEFGVAEFEDLEGTGFPEGSSFRAEKEGYRTMEWDLGEGIPKMEKEPDREDDLLLVWIVMGLIILILIAATFLIMARKRSSGPLEE